MDIPNTDSVNYRFRLCAEPSDAMSASVVGARTLIERIAGTSFLSKSIGRVFLYPGRAAQSISEYLSKKVERVPQEIEYELEISGQLSELLQYAYMTISHSSAEEMDVPHLVQGMLQLEDSWAGYLLKETVGEDMPEFLSSLISNYEHMNQFQEETSSEQEKSEPWRNYVTCLNEGLQTGIRL